MKRREFLKLFIFGAFFALFPKETRAEKKPENNLKEAMFWRRIE